MSRKAVLAVMAVVVLGGLNLWRYAGAPSDAMDPTSNGSSRGLDMQQISPLPRFNFPVTASTTPPQASRDLFDVVNAPTPPPLPEPTIAPEPVKPAGPDPREVAMEAARVNMLNVHVTVILSSQSGLSAMVNAPFFRGPAIVGTQLGEGIVVSVVNGARVRILHPELQLQRDIIVGE